MKAAQANDNPELYQYYYHPDHLGSSSFITNLDGDVAQHIEYVPFGEVFIEERNNVWNTPYLFNGKELDEETGLYYYGARYYNPRTSVWISSDPLGEKFPNVSSYVYCHDNPVMFIDPTGMEDIVVAGAQNNQSKGSKLMFINQGLRALREFRKNNPSESRSMVLFKGNYTDKQIEATRNSVEKMGGKLVVVNSAEEMTNYINSKSTSNSDLSNARTGDKITNIEIYAHGVVGSIEFGYHTSNAAAYALNSSNVNNMNSNAFDNGATIVSYACRTGLGNPNIKYFAFAFEPIKYNESLAQKIANATGASVLALLTRSDYSTTLGDWGQRHIAKNQLPFQTTIDGAVFTPYGANNTVQGGSSPVNVEGGFFIFKPK